MKVSTHSNKIISDGRRRRLKFFGILFSSRSEYSDNFPVVSWTNYCRLFVLVFVRDNNSGTHGSVSTLLSGVFSTSTVHLHVNVVYDIEKVLDDGDLLKLSSFTVLLACLLVVRRTTDILSHQ